VSDWWDDSGFSFGGDSGSNWNFGSEPTFNFGDSFSSKFMPDYFSEPNYQFAQQPIGGAGAYGGFGGGIGQPGSFMGGFQSPQQGFNWGSFMTNPQNLLGLLGGISGLAGTLAGGGNRGTETPKLDDRAKAQFGAAQNANAGLQPFAQGMTPLQKQQQQLLAAITSGKGLDQGYAKAIEGAFEPQMGNLYEQASAAGRKRGFHDAPATSPAGGAILGPGLADLQGQMAQAKINMMLGLPALFQNPINSQIGAAQGFANSQGNLFQSYPKGVQASAPLGPQIGTDIAGFLGGVGAGIGQQQNQQQQNLFQNRLMDYMFRQQQQPQQQGYSFAPVYGG
jgi:hypothetical protein